VATDSEMVEALPVARIDAKHLVNRIVEVAANSGRTNACLLRFEVQHLADEARALLRPRVTLSAANEPERTGDAKRSPSEGPSGAGFTLWAT
jgi:hypothetical protein